MTHSKTSICYQHSNVAAEYACKVCGNLICKVCAFPYEKGTGYQCPECTPASLPQERRPLNAPVVKQLEPGVNCLQHPNVPAVSLCHKCDAPICATCDFTFPNDLHICPKCAENNEIVISPKRKKSVIWSFVCASGALAIFVVFFVAAQEIQSESELELFSMLFGSLIIFTAAAGVALGFSAMDKRLGNTLSMWIATVWNLITLGAFILLCIAGLFVG